MTERNTYADFFAIDDKYYAAVTKQLIDEGKVSWKNFYPHKSFVELITRVYEVLSGKENRSLWLQGAYGTGKSHAALTVKSIIEAPTAEVEEYFERNELSKDLCQKILSIKNDEKLIVIHRIGSGDIHSEQRLILDVQDSIMNALKEHGIINKGEGSLREAALKWLSDPAAHDYMGALIKRSEYAWQFEENDIDDVIRVLKSDDDERATTFMRLLMQVGEENGVRALQLDAQGMTKWLRDLIRANKLSGILFIWDEFTEFFQNNRNSLTGFQTLAELSESDPFYFLLVTHKSEGLFNSKADAKKIMDRFVEPINIVLPENMAFHLMARAMRKTTDATLLGDWAEIKADLDEMLRSACDAIVQSESNQHLNKTMQLTRKDLLDIVPIHPYAALVLKHISVLFASNQRSMFDFIISNDEGAHAFKWFIAHNGPYDTDPLLTVDMLWDFFYVQGAKGLENTVRTVLDLFAMVPEGQLNQKEQRVFKTVLLLQGVAQASNDDIEILRSTARHIDLAFSGLDDWPEHSARSYAESLVKKGLLFARPMGNEVEYIAANNRGNSNEIEEIKDREWKNINTVRLVQSSQANILEAVKLPAKLRFRYKVNVLAADNNFTKTLNTMAQEADADGCHFQLAVCFALTDDEREKVEKLIEQSIKNPVYSKLIFLDAACIPLGKSELNQYIDALAYAKYYQKSDRKQSEGFSNQAEKLLAEWKERISNGSFVLYTEKEPSGKQCANWAMLVDALLQHDLTVYPYALERYENMNTMYMSNTLALGAQCGIEENLQKQYRSSNKAMSLDTTIFSGVWHVDRYWEQKEKSGFPIVRAKKHVESIIKDGFEKEGRVSLSEIFAALSEPKFGYLPCNITAVAMGFLLKEYANGEFFWSNGTASVGLDVDKLKMAISDTLKQVQSPSRKFKELYIVKMSPQQISFLNGTQQIFHVSQDQCGSVEQAQSCIRAAMPHMKFPLWCLKWSLGEISLKTDADIVKKAIDDYCGVASTANAGNRTAAEIASNIGQMFRDNDNLVQDLMMLFTDENIMVGMKNYLSEYRDGILPMLANRIDDGGAYIEAVHRKSDAEAANWVWNIDTANEKIDDVILDYQIIDKSNSYVDRSIKIEDTFREWNNRTRHICIAYEALGNTAGDITPLLKLLYSLKENRNLAKQDRQKFYDLLCEQGEAYRKFYENQFPYFAEVAKAYISDISDDEAKEIFNQLPDGLFTTPRTQYFDRISSTVAKYKESQAKMKLHELWLEKTGTKSPRDWSNKFGTPILCMFSDDERTDMRDILRIVGEANPKKSEVDRATSKLEKADFYDRLASKEERDRCFLDEVVGDNAFLLPSADEIREVLRSQLTLDPYNWLDNRIVKNKLDELVTKRYNEKGYDMAAEFIDKMTVNELKKYLQQALSSNYKFGIEVLKDAMRSGK